MHGRQCYTASLKERRQLSDSGPCSITQSWEWRKRMRWWWRRRRRLEGATRDESEEGGAPTAAKAHAVAASGSPEPTPLASRKQTTAVQPRSQAGLTGGKGGGRGTLLGPPKTHTAAASPHVVRQRRGRRP